MRPGSRIPDRTIFGPGFRRVFGDGGRVRQRALAAGCEEVYAKPLDPAVLEELLAKEL
jgi:hypothetical protein